MSTDFLNLISTVFDLQYMAEIIRALEGFIYDKLAYFL